MPAQADGDLSATESAWLSEHVGACAECREYEARFSGMDAALIAWGEGLTVENPPAPGQRELLAAATLRSSDVIEASPRAGLWYAVAAAAAIILAVAIPHRTPPAPRDVDAFVEIPYLAPLDPQENSTVVRMDIQVETLLALGYKVTADPDEVVSADVLVGEDGRAHAVRLRSDVALTGMGD
jgi:hypothetical protein